MRWIDWETELEPDLPLEWLEFPLTTPPSSKPRTLLRSVDSTNPPWLPSPLVPLALPWSGVAYPAPRISIPLAVPRTFISLVPFQYCRSSSTVAFRIHASTSVARATCYTLALWILPVTLAQWISVSTSGSSTICSAAIGWPPGVGSHSSMAPPSVSSTVGPLHDCGMGPA